MRAQTPSESAKGLRILLPALLLGGAAVLFLSLTRFPVPFVDEVCYADPGVNLVLGHGFTSSLGLGQPPDAFFAGNNPLWQVLLFAWLKAFGFSQLAVRSFALVCVLLAAFLLARAAVAMRWLRSPSAGLLLGLFAAFNFSSSVVEHIARPECLGILLFALAANALLLPRPARIAALFLLGTLVFWTGLQFTAFAGLLLLFLVACDRKQWREAAAGAAGLAIGAAILAAVYAAMGVLPVYLASNLPFALPHLARAEAAAAVANAGPPKDFSLAILLCGVLLAGLLWIRAKRFRHFPPPLLFALFFAFLVPLAMEFASRFPTYYAWMASVPLALVFLADADRAPACELLPPRASRLLVLAALLAGYPLVAASTIHGWNDRNPANARLLTDAIPPDFHGTIIAEPEVYYAIKERFPHHLGGFYWHRISDAERRATGIYIGRETQMRQWFGPQFRPADWEILAGPLRPTRPHAAALTRAGFLGLAAFEEMAVYRRKRPSRLDD